MQQEIGLSLKVTGMNEVISAFESIGRAVIDTQSKFTAFNSAFSGMGTAAQSGARNVSNAMRGIGSEVSTLKGEILSLKGAFGSLKMPAMTGLSTGSGGMGGQSSLLSAPMFMLKWWAAYKAATLASSALTDMGLGAGRKDIAPAESKLSSVGFNFAQKQLATMSANQFSRQFPNTTNVEFLNALNQTASALDVNQVGMAQLDRINRAAMMGARISQMSSEKFSENISKINRMALMVESPETFEALQSGGSANVKGYGLTNIAQMSEQNAAMVARVVQKSNIWGQGVMDSLQYAGAPLLQQGVDLRGAIAMSAGMVDAGFKGAKSGRALKSIFSKAPEALGRLWMLSEGEAGQDTRTGAVKFDPRILRARSAMIRQKMSNMDEMQAFIPEIMGKASKFADTLSKNPAIGLSLISDLKMSQDFLPQLLTFMSPTYWSGVMSTAQDLKQNATLPYLIRSARDAATDVFFEYQNFSQAIKRSVEQFSKAQGGIAETLRSILGRGADALDTFTGIQSRKNLAADLYRFKSTQDVMDFVNSDFMKKEYEQGLQQIDAKMGPRGSDKGKNAWSEEAFKDYDNQKAEMEKQLWNRILIQGNNLYEGAMTKPGSEFTAPGLTGWGMGLVKDAAVDAGYSMGWLAEKITNLGTAVKSTFTDPWVPESNWDKKGIERKATGGAEQTVVNNEIRVLIDGKDIPVRVEQNQQVDQQQQHYNSGSPLLMPSH
jgi:hypothetical protein